MNARLELVARVARPACLIEQPDFEPIPAARPVPATNRILDWPERDRPRERLLQLGAHALSDAELLSLFLNTGRPGMTSVDIARDLLVQFETLRGVLAATAAQLRACSGIGPAKAALLLAVSELCQRALAEKTRSRPLMDSPKPVEDYLKLLIGNRPHEVFVTLFLDVKHCLITTDESATGTISRVAVYPREIVRRALALNAASVIVAHNHPSGGVAPSASDRRLTRMLKDALALIDVQLLDHLVVASNEIFSFSRQGLLSA
jgi:DNA repair protein RadC